MKKLKVLLTNAPGLDLNAIDKKLNKMRGYALYPPLQLTTLASAAQKKVSDVEFEVLDLEFDIRKYYMENEKSSMSGHEVMKKSIISKMEEFKPDIVGIKSKTTT